MATAEQAIALLTQYDNTLARCTQASLSCGAGSPEAAARFAEHATERAALIELLLIGLRVSEAPSTVDPDEAPTVEMMDVDTATFGTVTELFA